MIWLVALAALGAPPVTDRDVAKRFSAEYRRCAPLATDDIARLNCIMAEVHKQNDVLEQVIEKRAVKLRASRKRAYVKQEYARLSTRNRLCLKNSRLGPEPVFAKQLKCRLFETIRHTIELERAR